MVKNGISFIPTKPQFFKPLLPGFFSHLKIPSAFFSKYLSGQNKYEEAVLRTICGEWTVKIEGQKFTDGWKTFARENNLDIGDFVVFKLEDNMVFGVVVFGSNACDKVVSQSNVNQNTDHGTPPLKKRVKANCIKSTDKSGSTRSGYPYFVSTIKPDFLSKNRFYIPTTFARENGLDRNVEIVLRDVMQRSWTVGLNKNGRQVRISRGWSGFRKENDLKLGDSIVFELICKGPRPIANFVPKKLST